MDFVRQQDDAPIDALVWGTRTLGTLNLGQKHKDNDKLLCSRSMYSYGLRSLAHLIQNPATVKSDRTLGAAVLCGIYEILDGAGHKSWLTHSSGIATLFRLRGAGAHRDGFGRTLLLAFRSFLIADAFICGKLCFLADPEWRSVIQYAVRQERLAGKGSELGDLVEYAFDTITVCPGLVAQARTISTGNTSADFSQRQELALEITRSRQRLTALHDRLEVLSSTLISDKGLEGRPDITGPIPVRIANMLADFCLRGMERAAAILDRSLSFVELGQLSLVQVGGIPIEIRPQPRTVDNHNQPQ
jgi:endoglycosylceramidase